MKEDVMTEDTQTALPQTAAATRATTNWSADLPTVLVIAVLGVVMTGMGNDGTKGSTWIKAAGGTVWAEAEESALIYGMPRCVVEAGLADRVIPLDQMARAILTSQ